MCVQKYSTTKKLIYNNYYYVICFEAFDSPLNRQKLDSVRMSVYLIINFIGDKLVTVKQQFLFTLLNINSVNSP